MTKLLEAESGRVLYRLREQMVEPAFGIIERAMGWSQMSMSGLDKATGHRRMDAGDDGVEHQGAACAAGGMMWEMACGNANQMGSTMTKQVAMGLPQSFA